MQPFVARPNAGVKDLAHDSDDAHPSGRFARHSPAGRIGAFFLFFAGASLLAAVCGCRGHFTGSADGPQGNEQALAFGVISTEASSGLRKGFEPFFEDMSRELGIEVKAFFAADYAGIIEAMRFGKVDVAWMGNKAAIEAVDRAGGEVFAQTVAADDLPGYWSVIIVHADSPFQTIDDVIAAGDQLTFGNGDPNSTSGYLLPAYYLWARRGIEPTQHFRRVVNSNHEANCLAVINKQVDFATNNTENLAQIALKRPELAEKIRVIWKSPIIALDPLVWRKDLPDHVKQQVRAFLFRYGREGPDVEREREVLANMSSGWAPFRESSNAQLIPVREIMLARQILDLEATAGAGPDTAELVELREQLAQLQRQAEVAASVSEDDAATSASAGDDPE